MKILLKIGGWLIFWGLWPFWNVYFRVTPPRSRVLVISGPNVLLVRGYVGFGAYDLPGGGVHRNELAIRAAIRELAEETGLIFTESELSPLCRGHYTQYGLRIRYVTFVAHMPVKRRLRLQRHEIRDAIWMPLKHIEKVRVMPDVLASISIFNGVDRVD